MFLRVGLSILMASALLLANECQQAPDCCGVDSERLSPEQTKLLLQRTEPIHPPCCANKLHIGGVIVLLVVADTNGKVTCIHTISGHPLMIGVAIESVKKWKFQPFSAGGKKKNFCGRVAIRYRASEYAVKYKVIEAP